MLTLASLLNYGVTVYRRVRSEGRLKTLEQRGLPHEFAECIRYFNGRSTDQSIDGVVRDIESRREEIARMDGDFGILYSPQPSSNLVTSTAGGPAKPGECKQWDSTRIANTGKSKKWGVVLYLLARAFSFQRGCELGTCVGISASYILSSDSVEMLLTVEGSEKLAETSRQTLERFGARCRVENLLFDDVLDSLSDYVVDPMDFCYIDGHHEKTATINYYRKLMPYLSQGAVVIFDDIRWSHDMCSCWHEIISSGCFSHAVDLGEIGVCIHGKVNEGQSTCYWDLRQVVGVDPAVRTPAGWSE